MVDANKYCLTPLIWSIKNSQNESRLVDARSLRVGCREGGGEKRSYCLMKTEFQFRKVKSSGVVQVKVAQQCQCFQCHWTVQLNIVKIACFMLCDFYHNKKSIHNIHNKKILKDAFPRSVGVQYDTGDQWRKNTRKNERGSQSKNNTQLWMWLVTEARSDAVKELEPGMLGPWIKANWKWSNRRWQ